MDGGGGAVFVNLDADRHTTCSRYCEAQAAQRAIEGDAILQSASPLREETNDKGHAS